MTERRPWYAILYVQVLIAIAVGILLGYFASGTGKQMKPLGDAGAGFITLAATLTIIPDIPIQSLAILVGIDKFMSECRALTNLIGNGVATVVASRWEGEVDASRLHDALAQPVAYGEALKSEPLQP